MATYSQQYSYDNFGRLSVADNTAGQAYRLGVSSRVHYDANGNIQSLHRGLDTEPVSTYSYYDAGTETIVKPNAVKSINDGSAYSYDAAGNVTVSPQSGGLTLAYDSYFSQPVSISSNDNSKLLFAYGAAHERILKQDYTSTGSLRASTLYVYGGFPSI